MLARWGGWGAVPQVFDPTSHRYASFEWARAELAELLSPDELAAATRNTLNAHYTDAAYVQAIWSGVARLGFAGGRALEPGCGSGNFLGLVPDGLDVELVGVELEPATAAIAQALYPHARIRAESFADTRLPEAAFDTVIGNVPFGDFSLADPRHNPSGHSIHNHFIIKSLHLTRPGGLVAVLTSRYTMDRQHPGARREIAELADLVGAVRLPSRAHTEAAGTDVVTDLLILRRREPGRDPAPVDWEQVQPLDLAGSPVPIPVNGYFHDHPEQVLGTWAVKTGQRHDLEVRTGGLIALGLEAAIGRIVERAHADHLTLGPRGAHTPEPVALVGRADAHDGHLAWTASRFIQVVDGVERPYAVPASQAAELRALLELRDAATALLAAEASSRDDTDEMARLRADLNRRYDRYVRAYGPINRFAWRRTGRVDQDTGQEHMARVRPPQGGFRSDPLSAVVYALEHFDPEAMHATKADVFRQRVISPRAPRLGADTPADALAICLDTHGEVHLGGVARLLGVPPEQARQDLGTLVFDDPDEPGRLIPAAEYLSGNVRVKLEAAETAIATDPRFAINVEALRGVLPADLGPDEIDARLGAAWIDPVYVQAFLREVLDDSTLVVEHPGGAIWAVRGDRHSVLATQTWGTVRAPAPRLAEALLEQRQIKVFDEVDKRLVLNPTETIAAQEKAKELAERFAEWAWADPVRARELTSAYNRLFNAIVLRSYDGAELSLPGLAASFQPRPHQLAAVARIIHEPAVLLAHDVGAGKTAEMIMGAMELRRLGLARKPAIAVPNHMLEQVRNEWLQLYPQARLLLATKDDLRAERRRQFIARCATGDWDAVVMTHSTFERIPMSPQAQRAYLDKETARLKEWIQAAEDSGSSFTVKRMERALLRAEERLKKHLAAAKDTGVTWEQTGIDYLLYDEGHGLKNLRTASNIQDASIEGSHRASDAEMKIDYLRQRNGRRVVTFATATPIANSITEAHVMQRFLRPDILAAPGVLDFDRWAATFGEVVYEIELAPAGGGFRMKDRLARFVNVPEMLKMWHVSADIKTAEDLKLPTPPLVAGGVETVVVEPSPELLDYIPELAERADQVRARAVRPDEDNMLKIATDGRLAALDLRLIGKTTAAPQKVDVVAERVYQLWVAHRDDIYPALDGGDDPVRGGLQLVFSDLGTPNDQGDWSVYEELRSQLAARGVPHGQIRFIHDAANDQQKAELFAAGRAGRVAVLIGSTSKMGVGTNVQRRAIALHNVDCPWRPADLAQRRGRIERQGNLTPEIHIINYVTEKSFDGFLWQTVERKARFIAQVMKGDLDVRSIEDIGETALSYQEVKALATGDPRLLERAQAETELARLERLERAWRRNQDTLARDIDHAERRIPRLETAIAEIAVAIGRRQPTSGKAFRMTVDGRTFDSRPDAGARLQAVIARELAALGPARQRRADDVARLGGFSVTVAVQQTAAGPHVYLDLVDVPEGNARLDQRGLQQTSPVGLVTRLENRLAGLEQLQDRLQADLVRDRSELDRARVALGQPFAHAEALAAARAHVDRLTKELEEQATPPPPASSTTAGNDGPPPDPGRTATPAPSQPATTRLAARAMPPASPTTISPAPPGAPPAPAAPTPTYQRPASAPASPQPPPSTPDTSATAAPAPAGQIRITHTDNDTLVRGTDREDLAVRKVLTANRFTWSRNQQFWYLPRPWAYDRRSEHVRGLVAGLRELGRPFQVEDGQVPDVPVPAVAPQPVTPLGDGPLSRLDQIVARATTRSGHHPASSGLTPEGTVQSASLPDPGHSHGQ